MPLNERVYHLVRHACLRSLSVEISTPHFFDDDQASTSSFSFKFHPITYLASDSRRSTLVSTSLKFDTDRDGVVLFGDDENGYTLCHTFRYAC